MSYFCYILKSINPLYTNNTYVGMTTNPDRRIRQHNGEIVGGAKATKSKQPHELYCIISGFKTINEALSYEWHIKHPTRKKKVPFIYSGIVGRIKGLKYVMEMRRSDFEINIYIKNDYKYLLDELENLPNIKVHIME